MWLVGRVAGVASAIRPRRRQCLRAGRCRKPARQRTDSGKATSRARWPTISRGKGRPSSRADTAHQQPGPDLDARKVGRPLLVEVKGYPSETYQVPLRAGERRRTNPRLQARHWFADALLSVVVLADKADGLETAIGPPLFDPDEDMVKRCERTRRGLGIGIDFVLPDGSDAPRLDLHARAVTRAPSRSTPSASPTATVDLALIPGYARRALPRPS